MTSHLAICSKRPGRNRGAGWVLAVLCLLGRDLPAAEVAGRIELRDSTVAAIARRGDYSGVVVSLQAVGQPLPAPAARVTLAQRNKTFLPHVLPVLVGSKVDFPNSDPIFHNAFSSYSGQIFDVGLYPPGTTRSVQFNRPGVVRVFCNIHPAMSAVILVLGTPWFTTTLRDGSFRLLVPAGTYDLAVFHERATAQTLQQLEQRIVVGAEGTRVQTIGVSEAGYLLAPHKNKFGSEYSPEPDDKVFYPGVRK